MSSSVNKQELKLKVREYLGFTDDSVDGGELGSDGGNTPDGSSVTGGRRDVGGNSENFENELEKLRLQFQLKQLEWTEKEKERPERREEREYEERKRKEEREHEERMKIYEQRVREQEREHELGQ